MIDTSEDILAHYGVKGMKWGVRKKVDSAKQFHAERHAKRLKKYGVRGGPQTRTQKSNRATRNIHRVNNTVMAVSAALFVAGVIESSRMPAPSNFSGGSRSNFGNGSAYRKPSPSVQDVINSQRKVKVDAIDKTFREGFITKEQRDQFVNSMNARYDRKVKEAGK